MKQLYLKSIAVIICLFSITGTVRATDYYLKSSGSLTSLSSWNTALNGSGTAPASFTGASDIWHFTNRTGATLSANFGAVSTATSVIESGFNLTVSTTFGSINSKINIVSTGSLTIVNNKVYNFSTLDPNSTVTYSFSSNTVKPANYGNLVVAVSTSLNASTGNIWVYGTLTINSGVVLNMSGYGLQLNGSTSSIAGAGTLSGSSTSFIELYGGGGGNNGALNFTSGSAILDYLYLQYNSSTDYISLGTNLTITNGGVGTFNQNTGSLNLNGKSLTIDNTADASFAPTSADGVIMGSATSALFLNGTLGVYSGATALNMDPSTNSLKVLSLNNASSTLDIGSSLNVYDSLSILNGQVNTNGNITLKSSTSLKGRLSNLTGTLNGNLTVETFAKGGSAGWAELGGSGINGLTFNSWYGQIAMTIEGSPTGVTSAGGYYFESVQGWNEADAYGYDTTMVVTSPINVGKGYWIYLASSTSSANDMVWTVSGSAVTGNVSIPLTKSAQNGDNLIANPYASPISWTKLRNSNTNVSNAVYTYNADGGVYASFVNGVGTNGGSDVIPMGQGFYVSALANTNLTAQESNKVPFNTSANQLMRPSASNNTSSTNIGQVIKLKLNGTNGDFDETAFRFHTVTTPAFDNDWDAKKIFATPGYAGYPGVYSYYTTISSKSGNQDYSVNSLPSLSTQSVSIPILVKVMSTGSYTIAPVDLQNLSNPSCAVLHDKLLNVYHPLINGPYVCNISDTTSAPRFELNICTQSIPTSVSNIVPAQNNLLIGQDQQGAYVMTSFDKPTKAVISVYNIVGQQLMDNITVNGTETSTYLPLNLHNQVVLVRVTTDKESLVKKIVLP
ncbi:MAG: beta strand repeat-containing protein [Bacteroidia bacterium]